MTRQNQRDFAEPNHCRLRVLHTSDWHIGHSLYGRKCTEEHRAFLDWLATILKQEKIDVLLVAGDVFDSGTPGNRSLGLYYTFLCRVAESDCRHVVITGGNHDSPSVLNAPREVLRFLDIHIIGSVTEDPGDEVLVLRNLDRKAELIVCAVPFLRDRDIREAEAGESLDDKGRKLIAGITNHYRRVASLAEQSRTLEGGNVPIVAMGHLFTTGALASGSDGIRDLYIGTLAHVAADIFPACFDYLALGHLHIPQKVGGSETKRYSGSPLPLSFGEAGQTKSVQILTFQGTPPVVTTLPVPCFLRLETIRGDLATILARLGKLAADQVPILVEVIYEGDEVVADLQAMLQEAVAGSEVHILRTANNRILAQALGRGDTQETLSQLSPAQVFDRCLDAHRVPAEQRRDLQLAFQEAVLLLEEDPAGKDAT
jgi:DNA repair protein SbcD/Mre11